MDPGNNNSSSSSTNEEENATDYSTDHSEFLDYAMSWTDIVISDDDDDAAGDQEVDSVSNAAAADDEASSASDHSSNADESTAAATDPYISVGELIESLGVDPNLVPPCPANGGGLMNYLTLVTRHFETVLMQQQMAAATMMTFIPEAVTMMQYAPTPGLEAGSGLPGGNAVPPAGGNGGNGANGGTMPGIGASFAVPPAGGNGANGGAMPGIGTVFPVPPAGGNGANGGTMPGIGASFAGPPAGANRGNGANGGAMPGIGTLSAGGNGGNGANGGTMPGIGTSFAVPFSGGNGANGRIMPGTLFAVPPAGVMHGNQYLFAPPTGGLMAGTGTLFAVPPAGVIMQGAETLSRVPPAGGYGGIMPGPQTLFAFPPAGGLMPRTQTFSAVPQAGGNVGMMPGTRTYFAVPPAGGNGGIMPGTETLFAVPPSGGLMLGTRTSSAVPNAGGNGGLMPGIEALFAVPTAGGNGGIMRETETLFAVPPAEVLMPRTETSSRVPPAGGLMPGIDTSFAVPSVEGNGGNDGIAQTSGAASKQSGGIVLNATANERQNSKKENMKQKSVLELNPSSSKQKNKVGECEGSSSANIHLKVLSSYEGSHAPVDPKPHSGPSALVQSSSEPRSCTSLREYLTSSDPVELSKDEILLRKVERLQIFTHVTQLVDAAQDEGVVLTDMRPSKFIFVAPGNEIRYTGTLVLAESRSLANHIITRKRVMEREVERGYGGLKSQKVGKEMEMEMKKRHNDMEMAGYHSQFALTYCCKDVQKRYHDDPNFVELEKKWYACVDNRCGDDLLHCNIYSLGVLLFELLWRFESSEKHSSAMSDLSKLILPEELLAKAPDAAGFCLTLLNHDPSSRPSTREILEALSNYTFEEEQMDEDEIDSEVLLSFLVELKERKEKRMARILEDLKFLDTDIEHIEKSHDPSLKDPVSEDHVNMGITSNLFKNISLLERAYFFLKSHDVTPVPQRPDTEILINRDKLVAQAQTRAGTGKEMDQVSCFFQGVCKIARYSKFEVCGTAWNSNLMCVPNGICSLSIDAEERYIASARVANKVKIIEFASLLDDSLDVPYTVMELSNPCKIGCVCWNPYIQNFLASADQNGQVKIWDSSNGKVVHHYKEHTKRAWSVDISCLNPTTLASTSDDATVKLWSMSQAASTATIQNRLNICSIQFSSHSSHLMAFGSANGEILGYDIRNMRFPWCILRGHKKHVTYLRFLDADTIVSAALDSTLKLWDLKRSSYDGNGPDTCFQTLTGHTNTTTFAGLADCDGYIACGSETNEVYAYHQSFPIPIATHVFGAMEPISGQVIDEATNHRVTSAAWGQKSGLLVAGNSSGSIKVLRLV